MSGTLAVNEIYLSLQGESTFAGLPCIFVRLTGCNLRCSHCDTAYAFREGQKRLLADVRSEVLRLAEPFKQAHPAERGVRNGPPISALPTAAGSPESGGQQNATRGAGQNRRLATGHGQRLPLVEMTGGEPLLQSHCLPLMRALCDDGFTVLLETSGALDISAVDPRVRRIVDLKCPSSGEASHNRWQNLGELQSTDELKFVIGTREDYEWSKARIAEYQLAGVCPLLFSWAHPVAPERRDASLKPVPRGLTPMSRQELAQAIVGDALPVRFQVQLHKIIWPPEQRGV